MLAINGSAGWVPGFWSRRSNSAGSKDTNKFPTFSENWKPSFHLGRRLSNGERRRKVGYARAATFNGKSGDPFQIRAERDKTTDQRKRVQSPLAIPALKRSPGEDG